MTRVFTIDFNYCNQRHIAMVTMHEEKDGKSMCKVKLFNKELHRIIPEGKINFETHERTLPPQIQSGAAEELYLNIRQVITNKFLQPSTALS